MLYERAIAAIRELPQAYAHETVLRAMTLFYLTHPKVFAQSLDAEAKALLNAFAAAASRPHTPARKQLEAS